jgi:hypothetical protein
MNHPCKAPALRGFFQWLPLAVMALAKKICRKYQQSIEKEWI